MYLQDIRINDVSGTIAAATLGLSRGLTVLVGSSTTGLSGWLESLAGLLQCLQATSHGGRRAVPFLQSNGRSSAAVTGELHVFSKARQYVLRQLPGAMSELLQCEGQELVEGATASALLLPRWLQSEELSRFCRVDAVESDDLRMLTRLTAAGEADYGSARELERARQALAQVQSDRDGNGLEGGIVHRISELRRAQGELQRRITALRDTGAEARKQAAELRRKLSDCESRLAGLAEESAGLESARRQLLQNSVGASAATAAPATNRSDMLQRWQKLRAAAAADLESMREAGGACLMLSSESLSAMRESILRMEERFRRLSEAGHAGGLEELDMGLAGSSLQQVRQEVTSLNNRLADYEQQLERQRPDDPLQLLIDQALVAIDAVLSALNDSAGAGRAELASGVGQQGAVALQQLDLKRLQLDQESHQQQRQLAELTAALQSPAPVTLSAQALEQLDQLQAQYGELDAEVQRLEQQRRQLDGAERRLRDAIEHLAVTRSPGVLDLAASILQRLTGGTLRTVQLEAHELTVVPAAVRGTVAATPAAKLAGLPRTQRVLVCLSLRLALLRICGAIDGIVPLMLTDDLLRLDAHLATPLVELLSESAEQGQQLLWLIEESQMPALQGVHQLEVRQLSATSGARELPPPPPRLVLHTVEHAEPSEPAAVTAPPVTAPPASAAAVAAAAGQLLPEVPVALASDVPQHGGANWLFYLELDHGVEDLAGVSLGELEALRAAKFIRVIDLLDRTVPELEEAIRLRGYMVPVERLQALRGQAELATRVPMLRRGDAALLFAAGITSADELRKLRPEAVYEKITAFQRSDAGARWRRSGRLIDRQQALNWARFGQFSRTPEELHAARSLARTAAAVTTEKCVRKPVVAVDPSDTLNVPAAAEQTTSGSRVIVTRRRRQVEVAPASAARRAKRVARREQLAAQLRVDPQTTNAAEGQPVERIGGMRFFLSRTSDVVQAPSIGPKTAEILHGAGVRTIEELLNVAPERIAEKLNQKRLTADIIRRWQVQAQLVCRIPELRGHDAQILAACGISTPESLASRTPGELLAAMKPFLETAEGRRVLRNQNGPDLQEVTEWIQWAANARPLRAA
jgi:hypothetical protein